jgi:hypothetical protein
MLNLNEIVLDHEDFFRIKLYQATMLMKSESKQWASIRNALATKYKFTVDLDTFSETLGAGVCVLPSQSGFWKKGSSVVDLFVRYTFEHDQDAAVREMLIYGLTERNRLEYYPSLTIPYLNHRFASLIPPNILGIIRIDVKGISDDEVKTTLNKWNNINNLYLTGSYDQYHSHLETL